MTALRRGDLAPGSWLRQDDLAEGLGVSKIPVREALQRLAGVGLLRFERNRGVQVPELAPDDAEEIFELRRGVEVGLLTRALPRMTKVELAEAEFALESASDAMTEANWLFHRALYRAASWSRGLAWAEILHAAVAPYVQLYVEALGGADRSEAEHAALLKACQRGDVQSAVETLRGHLDRAEAALVDGLRQSRD